MKKRTDDGRTKFNTDAGQFQKTHQKASAGQDVPLNDDQIHQPKAGPDEGQRKFGSYMQDREEQRDMPMNPKIKASQTGHGDIGKSDSSGQALKAPKKGAKTGVERKGGTQK